MLHKTLGHVEYLRPASGKTCYVLHNGEEIAISNEALVVDEPKVVQQVELQAVEPDPKPTVKPVAASNAADEKKPERRVTRLGRRQK